MIMAYFKVLSQNLHEGTAENYKKVSVSIAGL